MRQAQVLWLTGLSGAGKSTIAQHFADILSQEGQSVWILDGDDIRDKRVKKLTFTVNDIKKNNELIAKLCLKEINKYDYIIVAVISPFAVTRQQSRHIIGENYNEIYIKADLETLIQRDTKGLYKRANKHEIDNFIGISKNTPYEEPQNPELIIDTENNDVKISVDLLVRFAKNL